MGEEEVRVPDKVGVCAGAKDRRKCAGDVGSLDEIEEGMWVVESVEPGTWIVQCFETRQRRRSASLTRENDSNVTVVLQITAIHSPVYESAMAIANEAEHQLRGTIAEETRDWA